MSSKIKKPRVVIIGAGLAGLSAAYRLIELGCKDFLILEAKSRAGGRIESIHYQDGSRIDLGAQWLHGEKENPVYEWLEDLGLIEGFEEEDVELEGLFRTQFGTEPQANVVARVLDLAMEAKHFLYKVSGSLNAKCKPVDMFREQIRSESVRCPILKGADPELVEAVLKWFELYETIDNSCEDFALLSMKAYSNWTDFDHGKMMKLKGGWQNLIDILVDRVTENRILFNCPVDRLIHTSDSVIVKCANGDILTCKHVIVTFSAGVMKNLSPSFFEPKLEDWRRVHLSKLGFGVVNKIFLQFERPYLSKELGLKLLWIKRAGGGGSSPSNDDRSKLLPSWTKFMTGFDLVNGAPNFLLCWVGGEGAKMVEKYSESEIGETCLQVLRLFAPDKQPAPKLISVARSTWFTDRFVQGAYSYESIETVSLSSDPLWKPIYGWNAVKMDAEPRIQFAGEATALTMYATAHGAIISGWREAERLIGKSN